MSPVQQFSIPDSPTSCGCNVIKGAFVGKNLEVEPCTLAYTDSWYSDIPDSLSTIIQDTEREVMDVW